MNKIHFIGLCLLLLILFLYQLFSSTNLDFSFLKESIGNETEEKQDKGKKKRKKKEILDKQEEEKKIKEQQIIAQEIEKNNIIFKRAFRKIPKIDFWTPRISLFSEKKIEKEEQEKIKPEDKITIERTYNQELLKKYNPKIKAMNNNTKHKFPGADVMNGVEKICKLALETYFDQPFVKVRPDFLKNPETGYRLEIDCYNPDIVLGDKKGLGLEYQGPTHYDWPNWTNQTKEDFLAGIRRDQYKKDICKEKNIVLIEVPDVIAYNSIPLYIFNLLDSLGYESVISSEGN